jgi:hypothetical protein
VPVLARKPGALRNGAPFKDWVLPPAMFAEFETNLRRERRLGGIAKAKAAGVYKGRPASMEAARVQEQKARGMRRQRGERKRPEWYRGHSNKGHVCSLTRKPSPDGNLNACSADGRPLVRCPLLATSVGGTRCTLQYSHEIKTILLF